ncbi:rhomboid domain-containing protein 2 [Hemibagrus wyckioides]|uniref:rhomboid domain-containing protein 2 n=1 Tax=Hemibagrus wyckioides TaxID=337641 RepID=UPI00266C8FD0|nr:rhomboid domain-containing protein 2 [Hemibagrus wyckioides]
MRDRFRNVLWKISSFVSAFEFTSGVVFVVTLSCVLSIVTNYCNISEHALSLESSVLLNGHVHRLLTYCFYHKDVGHLFSSVAVLMLFCSGLEKGVGTVRFLYLLLFLVTSTGLIHVLLELLLFSPSSRTSVSGLIPVSLAMLGMVTISSRMRKAFLLGFTLPTAALPWFLMLIVYLFIPNTVFLCNFLAVITGQMYGMQWFSVFQMSESKACVVEKIAPFRLLKKITCVRFIPASAGERKKILHTICSPSPGSYPVQAYASASMLASQASGNAPSNVDGWSNSTIIQQNYTIPSQNHGYSAGPSHGHNCGHSHGHSHHYQARNFWMPKALHGHSHCSPPKDIGVQSFGNPLNTTAQADSVHLAIST